MNVQSVTPDLRRWIVEQATAGQPPAALLTAMLSSGWDESIAVDALDDTLRQALAQAGPLEVLPPAVAVPEPLPQGTRATLRAADRDVTVVASLRRPRVVVFANLLSADECDEIIAMARLRLARSETVQTDTGSNEINDSRTSQGMFFSRGENALCARLEERIAALVGWPQERGEGLQVLRYGPGAEYKPHYDFFDPDHCATSAILERGGQRVASLVCYLNTPLAGGATTFPEAGLEVAAVKGHAVFFSYDRPHPVTHTLHGGAPVVEGEKWVATKWLRERRFT